MPVRKSLSLAHAFRCPYCRLHRGSGMGQELCQCEERKKNETPKNKQMEEQGMSAPPAPKRGGERPRKVQNQDPVTPEPAYNDDEDNTIIVASSSPRSYGASQVAGESPLQHRSTGNPLDDEDDIIILASSSSTPRGASQPAEESHFQQRSTGNRFGPLAGLATPRRTKDAYTPAGRTAPSDIEAEPSTHQRRRNSADAPEVVPARPVQPTGVTDYDNNDGPSQGATAEELESSTAQAEQVEARNRSQQAAAEQAYRLHEEQRRSNRRLGRLLAIVVFLIVMYLFWCWYNAADFGYIRRRRGEVLRE